MIGDFFFYYYYFHHDIILVELRYVGIISTSFFFTFGVS